MQDDQREKPRQQPVSYYVQWRFISDDMFTL